MQTLSRLSAIALIAGSLAAPALAGERFSFDLEIDRSELATEEGAAEVYADLRERVEKECKTSRVGTRVTDRFARRTCTERTLDDAVALIDEPMLAKVHEDATAQR